MEEASNKKRVTGLAEAVFRVSEIESLRLGAAMSVVPFLVLFGLSVVNLVGLALEASGVIGTRIFLDDRLLTALGIAGTIIGIIFTVNAAVIVILLLVSIPLYLFYRDVRRTLVRFDVLNTIPAISPTDDACFQAAKELFASDPDTYVFIYGHTHNASFRKIGERVVINTGTWLKKLEQVPARFLLLPAVYHPSFRLNYFRISEDDGRIAIDYERVRKASPRELSLLQRLVAKGPQRDALEDIPENDYRVAVDGRTIERRRFRLAC